MTDDGGVGGWVEAVHARDGHGVGKTTHPAIRLLVGLGVEGDAHAGVTVKHRSRVAKDPSQPNLRQVHLIHGELVDELRASGFDAVHAGAMGENVTTRGVPLLDLPTGTLLRLGGEAVVELTGLRNPCVQLDGIQPGLMAAVLGRSPEGELIRKAGVMAVVRAAGEVPTGAPVVVVPPPLPHEPLRPV